MFFDRLQEVSYKSVDGIDIELGQLTIFYGANNSGKSNLLEAIALGTSPFEDVQAIPAGLADREGEQQNSAFLVVARQSERDLRKALLDTLINQAGGESPGSFTDDHISIQEWEDAAAAALAATPGDAHRLALTIVRAARVILYYRQPMLWISHAHLDGLTLRLAADVDSRGADNSVLQEAAGRVASGGGSFLAMVSLGHDEALRTYIGHFSPFWIDLEPSGLETEIAEHLLTIPERTAEDDLRNRPWLIPTGDGFAFHPSVLEALSDLEARTNQMLPRFVKEEGSVKLVAEPDTTVRVLFLEDGEPRPLAWMGRGFVRWIAASIRFAIDELQTFGLHGGRGFREIGIHEGHPQFEIVLQSDPNEYLPPLPIGSVIVVDEPEAHLHPRAVSSLAQWLYDLAGRTAVFVATHHDEFLRLPESRTRFVRLTKRRGGGSLVANIDPGAVGGLQELAAEVGIRPGMLVTFTRLVLFVEGEHELAFLGELFGPLLDSAGVQLVQLRGAKNVEGIVAFEVLREVGLAMAVLTDNTQLAALSGPRNKMSGEEKAVDRLLREAESLGVTVEPFGLTLDDILHYVPDDICRDLAPGFPGWDQAMAAARDHAKSRECPTCRQIPPADRNWKRFIGEHFGLACESRSEVAALARAMLTAGKPPDEVTEVVAAICDHARSVVQPGPTAESL